MVSKLRSRPGRPLESARIAAILRWSLVPIAAGWGLASGACTIAHPDDDVSQDEPRSGDSEPEAETVVPTGTRAAASGPVEPAGASREDGSAARAPAAGCAEAAAEVGAFWIAFDSDRAAYNRDLYAIRVDGSGLTRLTKGPSSEREPAFSFDGKRLAYVSDASGNAQIYVYDFASGARTQLTRRPEGADQPSWSRDGLQLVFHSGPSAYIIDADGGGERELTRGLDSFNAHKNPAFSADGREIVFDRNNEINAIGSDGTGLRQVVHNWTTTIVEPSVSADGYNIAYTESCSVSGNQITVVPLASDAVFPCEGSRASVAGEHAQQPAWGPRHFIAYVRSASRDAGASRIAISVEAGAACTLEAERTSRDLNPSWAPEGFELPSGFEPF